MFQQALTCYITYVVWFASNVGYYLRATHRPRIVIGVVMITVKVRNVNGCQWIDICVTHIEPYMSLRGIACCRSYSRRIVPLDCSILKLHYGV